MYNAKNVARLFMALESPRLLRDLGVSPSRDFQRLVNKLEALAERALKGDGKFEVPARELISNFKNIMSKYKTKITPEGYHVLENDTHISRWVEEHKTLACDPALFGWLLPRLAGIKRAWDVGAFIGDHTAAYLSIPGIEKVHAFEPNPEAYYCLEKNFWGREDCTCWNIAASDKRERLSFETAPNAGASRLKETGAAVVAGFALDSFMRGSTQVDYIKLDVEGWELKALEGMRGTIAEHRPKVFVEINTEALRSNLATPDQIFEFFDDLDYRKREVYPVKIPLDSPQYDVLFTP